jgi:hypothetical protein
VLTIVALALYPALITERGEASVNRSLSAVAEANGSGSAPVADKGWTGYTPVAEVEP